MLSALLAASKAMRKQDCSVVIFNPQEKFFWLKVNAKNQEGPEAIFVHKVFACVRSGSLSTEPSHLLADSIYCVVVEEASGEG